MWHEARTVVIKSSKLDESDDEKEGQGLEQKEEERERYREWEEERLKNQNALVTSGKDKVDTKQQTLNTHVHIQ